MVELIVNPDSFRESESKLAKHIFSEIYFSIDNDIFFPEKGWDDFAVVVMGWWLPEVMSAAGGNVSICRFMDGPYSFRLEPRRDFFEISFIVDESDKGVLSRKVNQLEFMKGVVKSANLLVRMADEKGICHDDVEVLRSVLKAAQKFVKSSR